MPIETDIAVNPHHDCWWSNHRSSELQLLNSDLTGYGVSFSVLVRHFSERDLTWYSASWGQNAEDENVFALATKQTPREKRQRYDGPVSRSFPRQLTEYQICDDVLEELGVIKTAETYQLSADSPAELAAWMHDDCVFSIRLKSEADSRHVIANIVEMHGDYLSQAVNGKGIAEDIAQLLGRGDQLRLVSDEVQNRIIIKSRVAPTWLRPWSRFDTRLVFSIENGKSIRQAST